MNKKIDVTSPFLPPLEEFQALLPLLWENRNLTNGGVYHNQLEAQLASTTNVGNCSLINNGTIALLLGLKALGLSGEVITTPFSFIATSHVLMWLGLRPVFVDIDPVTLNLSPDEIEDAITPQTSAILGVHCYGTPCDVEAIDKIAKKHSLQVIYDAAHAFGVEDDNGSILRHGDLSVVSFHATKVFHTFEGGGVFSQNAKLIDSINNLRNFGIKNYDEISDLGLNGKLNEVSCAMGLIQLKHFQTTLIGREKIDACYRAHIECKEYIRLPATTGACTKNYSYFPILVKESKRFNRNGLYDFLQNKGIFTRKYFYPLISDQTIYRNFQKGPLITASVVASEILCLPIYPDMELEDALYVLENIDAYFQQ